MGMGITGLASSVLGLELRLRPGLLMGSWEDTAECPEEDTTEEDTAEEDTAERAEDAPERKNGRRSDALADVPSEDRVRRSMDSLGIVTALWCAAGPWQGAASFLCIEASLPGER